MTRANLTRLVRLERTGNRVTNWRYMTDEQLLEAACDYDPAVMSTVIPAFRAGGLDAGFAQLFKVRFSDDPENLALIIEADRRGDCETVARMLGKGDARTI
ncbi:MAG: hypothetical protein ACR65T_13255 [Methylocystis sp.]|jgi:hypothetical protein|uniref:hypothetical protein n=1 Tax=Methylocystis sp. TaxID=1911079 RepID=UPI003DA673AF